jgi:uncharacterized RDD family membrane protein YckC
MTDVTDKYIYAGFWRGFWALVIDAITIHLLFFFLVFVVALALALAGIPPEPRFEEVSDTSYLGFITLFWLLYRILLESSPLQATVGKLALSIKVMDTAGQRIGLLRAAGRSLATLISDATLLIGYIMAAFTPRKRALHDVIAGCLVVRTDVRPIS